MNASRAFSLAALLLNFCAHAMAEEAHVHGAAQLNVSVEGETLRISLESPLDNLLGFERSPKAGKETEQVRKMATLLRQGDKLFVTTPEAACKLSSAKLASAAIDPALLGEPPAAKASAQNASSKARSDEPEHHGHDHDHDHADLDANFVFRCAHAAALTDMEVKLFDAFPGFRQVKAQVVTAKRQLAARLTPKARKLSW